jgi:hypothetical protein
MITSVFDDEVVNAVTSAEGHGPTIKLRALDPTGTCHYALPSYQDVLTGLHMRITLPNIPECLDVRWRADVHQRLFKKVALSLYGRNYETHTYECLQDYDKYFPESIKSRSIIPDPPIGRSADTRKFTFVAPLRFWFTKYPYCRSNTAIIGAPSISLPGGTRFVIVSFAGWSDIIERSDGSPVSEGVCEHLSNVYTIKAKLMIHGGMSHALYGIGNSSKTLVTTASRFIYSPEPISRTVDARPESMTGRIQCNGFKEVDATQFIEYIVVRSTHKFKKLIWYQYTGVGRENPFVRIARGSGNYVYAMNRIHSLMTVATHHDEKILYELHEGTGSTCAIYVTMSIINTVKYTDGLTQIC